MNVCGPEYSKYTKKCPDDPRGHVFQNITGALTRVVFVILTDIWRERKRTLLYLAPNARIRITLRLNGLNYRVNSMIIALFMVGRADATTFRTRDINYYYLPNK